MLRKWLRKFRRWVRFRWRFYRTKDPIKRLQMQVGYELAPVMEDIGRDVAEWLKENKEILEENS